VPSNYETFGLVVIEALACKTPVLASSKVPVAREISGVTLTGTDSESIKKGITYMQEHYKTAKQKTAKSHSLVVRKYAKEAVLKKEIDQILKWYEQKEAR
jgi:glycosyltransferase involved in cell wall biosynthesis